MYKKSRVEIEKKNNLCWNDTLCSVVRAKNDKKNAINNIPVGKDPNSISQKLLSSSGGSFLFFTKYEEFAFMNQLCPTVCVWAVAPPRALIYSFNFVSFSIFLVTTIWAIAYTRCCSKFFIYPTHLWHNSYQLVFFQLPYLWA